MLGIVGVFSVGLLFGLYNISFYFSRVVLVRGRRYSVALRRGGRRIEVGRR